MVIVSAENFWNELTKVIHPSGRASCIMSLFCMLPKIRSDGAAHAGSGQELRQPWKFSALFQSENIIDQLASCCRSEQGRTAEAFHAFGTSCGSASFLVAWKTIMWLNGAQTGQSVLCMPDEEVNRAICSCSCKKCHQVLAAFLATSIRALSPGCEDKLIWLALLMPHVCNISPVEVFICHEVGASPEGFRATCCDSVSTDWCQCSRTTTPMIES